MLFVPIIYLILKLLRFKNAFYQQQRVGFSQKIFIIYKIKTLDANLQQCKFTKFLRLTGLDELPQVVNILKGDMSVFGPRPIACSDYDNVPPDKKHLLIDRRKPGLFSLYISRIGPGKSIYFTQPERIKSLEVISSYEQIEARNQGKPINVLILFACLKSIFSNLYSFRNFKIEYNIENIKHFIR